MKSLIILLMISSAMGQTGEIFGMKPTEAFDLTLESPAFCVKTITLGKTSKAIKDIFPEECGGSKEPKSYIKICSGITGKCDDEPAEAPDVPAVTTKKVTQCVIPPNTFACDAITGSGCPCGHYEDHLEDTCAEKSRILLTAEDGKKWCHKPVTK